MKKLTHRPQEETIRLEGDVIGKWSDLISHICGVAYHTSCFGPILHRIGCEDCNLSCLDPCPIDHWSGRRKQKPDVANLLSACMSTQLRKGDCESNCPFHIPIGGKIECPYVLIVQPVYSNQDIKDKMLNKIRDMEDYLALNYPEYTDPD